MKIKYILLAGCASVMLSACRQDIPAGEAHEKPVQVNNAGKSKVAGKWVLDSIDVSGMSEGLSAKDRAQVKAVSQQMLSLQRGKMSFDIREGGELRTHSLGINQEWKDLEGSWELKQGDTLTINIQGRKESYVVRQAGNEMLDLELAGQKMRMIMIPAK